MRGQTLELSSFTISIGREGADASEATLSTSTHMAPYWLEAAIGHAQKVFRLARATNEAFQNGDAAAQTHCLNAELIASMQALACSAFAFDALYASLLRAQPASPETIEAWKKNRTKRSRQIFETMRRAFKFGPKSGLQIRTFLDELSKARDAAVHPPAKSREAQRHARLPVSIDPAFNMFRAHNALVAVGMSLSIINQLSEGKLSKNSKIAGSMSALNELVSPLQKRWKRTAAGKEFLRIVVRDEAASAQQ